MKIYSSYLIALISSINLFASEPIIRCYLNDGTSKQYNIKEIDTLSFIKSEISFWCTVNFNKNLTRVNFDVPTIDKIYVDTLQIKFALADTIILYNLYDIDSITFSPNVKICNQIWMSKNLDVDHFSNGDSIPEIRDNQAWMETTSGAWCYYQNDPKLGAIYGKLYNWYAVNDPRGLAPKGWKVASQQDWSALTLCLGGSNVAGGKIKEKGSSHWLSPNMNATNESGFTALPAGDRQFNGAFIDIYGYTGWWDTQECPIDAAAGHSFGTMYLGASIGDGCHPKLNGFSVRCLIK